MSARIVFTLATPGPTSSIVTQPIQHEVDSIDRVSAQKLIATNVGGSAAVNCGFYVTAVGEDTSPSGLSELTELFSWAYEAGSNGIITVVGDEVTAFELLASADLFTSVANRHNYEQGSSISNSIPLTGADGTDGDEMNANTGVPLYIFVRIPAAEPAARYNFTYHFYYEEVV